MRGIMNKFGMLFKILALSGVALFLNGMSLQVLAQTDKGMELYNSWEYEKAEKAFRKALIEEPTDVQAGYNLGLSLLMQGKYKEALDVLQNVKASGEAGLLDKGQLEISLTRANLGLERYSEALERLKAAERAKADPVDVHTFRGAYYLEKNSVKEAAQELEKAIELESQNAYTYYYAGFAYLRSGNPEKAVQMFQTFLRLSPYAPEAAKTKSLVDSLC